MINIEPIEYKGSTFTRYALSFLFFVIALFVRFKIAPGDAEMPFVTFYPTMVITFYLCGTKPGALFAILSAISGYYLFNPFDDSFIPRYESLITLSAFSISATLIGLIIHNMQRALVLLKQSELRYQSFLEDQTEVICRFKADHTIIYVNDAYCRFFGKSRTQLIGKKWHPVVYTDDIQMVCDKVNSLSPTHFLVNIENRVLTGHGEIRWMYFINRAFFDEQGILLEVQSVGRDITEQKQAEMKNLELYKRLTEIASRVPGVIYQYLLRPDGSSCFPYASDAIYDIYRVTPEQVRNDASDVYAILHPDDYDSIVASIQQSATTLKPWQHEYRVRFADGTVRWLSGNALPHKQEDGAILWHGFITDCSERKAIEEALQSESFKNQIFLRNASDGVIIMDYDGYIVEASDSFCNMLGYTREETLGMHVSQWEAKFTKSELMPLVWQLLEKKTRTQFETHHRRKDGSCYDAEVSVLPIELNGKTFGFSSTRDITDRKQLEQQLIASTQEIQDLYNNAPCGYHSIDKNGVILNINETELQWLGCTRDEVLGENIAQFFTPAGRVFFKEKVLPKLIEEGHSENAEYELIGRNGTVRQISVSATAITDNIGNFLKSRSVLYDITELKNTQKSLNQLTIEQQAMLDNDLIGIVKLRNRQIVWINKAMERMFGYSQEEMRGQLTRIFYLDDASYQALGTACYPILNAHGIYRTQIEMLHKNGEKIWIDLSGVELLDNNTESVWMLLDITELKKYQQKIEHIAYHDALTGLPNRLLVADRLEQVLALSQRTNQTVAVCYLDLDGFKPINDQFGHAAGDKLLIEIARRMQIAVRVNDTVGRLGGDEFVLILTDIKNVNDCQFVLRRMLEVINAPILIDDLHEVCVGASIGVALFPEDNNDADMLLRHADHAMYQAKQSGRNCVCLYNMD